MFSVFILDSVELFQDCFSQLARFNLNRITEENLVTYVAEANGSVTMIIQDVLTRFNKTFVTNLEEHLWIDATGKDLTTFGLEERISFSSEVVVLIVLSVDSKFCFHG